jgi:hypothetical protein
MREDKTPQIICATFFLFTVFFLWLPAVTTAEEILQEKNAGEQIEKVAPENTSVTEVTEPSDENQTPFQKIKNYFSADLRILTYGIVQEPAKTSQNPNNDFMQYPQ